MFRNVVLVLISHPLLVPPGVCLCGAGCTQGGESRFCGGHFADASLASCFEGVKTNLHSFHGRRDVPNGDQCPPCCPGNQKTDHSKLVERSSAAVPAWAAAVNVVSFYVNTPSTERIHVAATLLWPSVQPIYITLCTLVI